MKTKSKLLFVVAGMLLLLSTATIVNVSINFKDYTINSAVEKSKMVAKIVEDGLTAHMVNGTMDQREYFLEQISKSDEIKSLWLVRSKNVIEQYGEGFNQELPRDDIDKKVLKRGESIREILEQRDRITLRITIPYKATIINGTNCLSCHNVNRGDTLGAVSMKFDITNLRTDGYYTIAKILAINLIFLIIVIILINYFVAPYTKLFTNIQDGIKKAYSGDFTHRFDTTIKGDAKDIVEHMNTLFSKIQETFGDIKHNLATFIPQGSSPSSDPLYEAKTIIQELSDIYKFKKTIERDLSKESVYNRIIDIIKYKYSIEHFAFYEVNDTQQNRELIYITHGESICLKHVDKNVKECRTYRTESNTISTDFKDVCQTCDAKGVEYLCLFFNINNEASLLLSFTAPLVSEINRINSLIPSIRHYLEAAKPVVESKLLMEKLRDTSLRDAMTGLYNRRFLEEFIDQVMSQAQRENETYSVMMLDVDFFKMVNDTYGHDIGDKVIVEIGKLLLDNVRNADLAIRYGGEEFIVMLHNATDEGALKVATKIHSAFAKHIFDVGSGETMQKTMSIGMATFPTDGDTIWKCIKYADTALYEAKSTGRNKIVKFKPEMFEGEEF
ncbi:MAG: GGDEF domain-containing protein [Campylobacterota bacterium]|nr:GGDEF domain-containing protein [Campylobacterota bacterium]